MTLRELLTGLRRSAVTILVFVILGVVAAGTYIATAQKQYTAKTRLLAIAVDDTGTLTQNLNGNQLIRNSIQSYADLVTSPTVLDPLVQTLGISETSLAAKITADVPLNTLFIDISAQDPSASRAAQIASAVAQQAITSIQTLQSSSASSQTSPVRLTDVEPATPPSSASSPKPVLDLVIGLIVGLGLGLAVAGARGLFIAVPAPVYGVPPTPAPRVDEPAERSPERSPEPSPASSAEPLLAELVTEPAAPEPAAPEPAPEPAASQPAAPRPPAAEIRADQVSVPESHAPAVSPIDPPEVEVRAVDAPVVKAPTDVTASAAPVTEPPLAVEPVPAPTPQPEPPVDTPPARPGYVDWSDRANWAAPNLGGEPSHQPAYTEPAYTEPSYTEPTYTKPAATDPEAAGVVWERPKSDPLTDEHVDLPYADSADESDEDTPPWGVVPVNPESSSGDPLRP